MDGIGCAVEKVLGNGDGQKFLGFINVKHPPGLVAISIAQTRTGYMAEFTHAVIFAA